MALPVCLAKPTREGYTVQYGDHVVSTSQDSGPSKVRFGTLRNPSIVNVQWVCFPLKYDYLRAFYRTRLSNGSLPFLIELRHDQHVSAQYEARFVPNAMSLASVSGDLSIVTAQLEVISNIAEFLT